MCLKHTIMVNIKAVAAWMLRHTNYATILSFYYIYIYKSNECLDIQLRPPF